MSDQLTLPIIRRVRVTSPYIDATFETDGRVLKADPILAFMVGWPDDQARKYLKRNHWKAVIIRDRQAA